MQAVETENAPAPVGSYSQGIIEGDRVYVSGQVGLDPETGEVVSENLAEQTMQTMENLSAVLEAAGTSLDNTVKATVYVTDIEKFDVFDEIYGEYMTEPRPARAAIEAGDLVSPFKVEIELIARLSG